MIPEQNESTGANGRHPLDRVAAGTRVRVVSIEGGVGIRRNLSQLGIHVGDELTVRRRGIIGGPIIVESSGTRTAIGRGMAVRVMVRSVSDR